MAVGSGGWGTAAKGCSGKWEPQTHRDGPERQGSRDPGLSEPPDWSPVGIPGRDHPVVWGTLICEGRRPLSPTSANLVPVRVLGFLREAKAGVRRRGHTSGADSVYPQQRWAPAPTGSCVCVHRWPRGPGSTRTGPGRLVSLLPFFLLFFLLFFQQIGCFFCSRLEPNNGTLAVSRAPSQPAESPPAREGLKQATAAQDKMM